MRLRAELLLNDRETIGGTIAKLLGSHNEAFFAVAYGTYNAVELLGQGHALELFARTGGRLRAVFDVDRHFTDPELIDELCTIPGDVECRLYGPRIRGVHAPHHVFDFHPKVYYFESKGRAAAVVGSANFSLGGLSSNCEVAVLLDGARDEVVFRNLKQYLEKVWTLPALISVDQYEKFRDEYGRAYRAARAKEQRRGVLEDIPLVQVDQDVVRLKKALEATQEESAQPTIAYVLGLVAGGIVGIDRTTREVVLELRRGVLNRGKPVEGRIFFGGISEPDIPQSDCVRRDAERIVTRLSTAFAGLSTGDMVRLERISELVYHLVVTFSRSSRIWRVVKQRLGGTHAKSAQYLWPQGIDLANAEVRRSFLQGYMDLRTRITATDALPGPKSYMRVAVSIGGKALGFAEQLRNLMAEEFGSPPERINLAEGLARDRENMIRIDARLLPKNFLESPWQRIVVSDFSEYNRRLDTERHTPAKPE